MIIKVQIGGNSNKPMIRLHPIQIRSNNINTAKMINMVRVK